MVLTPSAGPTLPSMMAGKWLVERSAAAGGAWARIGGRWLVERSAAAGGGPKPLGKVDAGDSADGAGNGGGPKPLGKVDASIIDCILEWQSETGDGGRKIVRVEGAPEASGSGRFSQSLPFHEAIVVACGCWRSIDNACW